jgi:hypothetical protein
MKQMKRHPLCLLTPDRLGTNFTNRSHHCFSENILFQRLLVAGCSRKTTCHAQQARKGRHRKFIWIDLASFLRRQLVSRAKLVEERQNTPFSTVWKGQEIVSSGTETEEPPLSFNPRRFSSRCTAPSIENYTLIEGLGCLAFPPSQHQSLKLPFAMSSGPSARQF